ncbi:pilus assembly protein TadG-related protein [Dongia soli]|uniref:Pilus assembly protein TadG-related protein n=1 Tax=Dongia soli TaxID=600628 RepID=A0ABU5EAA9_9PROT|nr:pilus assembly protein TadG-related protein [Dongia soli]MDY0883287.1 pilus assembly protein TadG-related protein [Dongia soli]
MRLRSFLPKQCDLALRAKRRLWRDTSGSVALYVAVTMTVMIAAVGIGIDTARAFLLKSKLSQALDAAALAGGKVMMSSNRDSDIEMFFNANFPANYMGATVNGPHIEEPNGSSSSTLTLSATADIKTIFGSFLGVDTMTVAASTEVTRALKALDVVLSIDVSGSMKTYDDDVRDAANDLVDILFDNKDDPPEVTIDGVTYQLLHIGLVPWNSKVNIKGSSGVKLEASSTISNPVTGKQSQSWDMIYPDDGVGGKEHRIKLLTQPDDNWKGCVYARYLGDDDQGYDNADLTLGYTATWPGWQPIPTLEGEPREFKKGEPTKWDNKSGGYMNGTDWTNTTKVCDQSYWNDSIANSVPHDLLVRYPSSYPATNGTPNNWKVAKPNFGKSHNDCDACYERGITRLQTNRLAIRDAIGGLDGPKGSTNITQGLFWAYQTVMPGAPFNDALTDEEVANKFPRNRAIVLLTDGETVGGNGDAYKGYFGSGTQAGTNTSHGMLSAEGDYWPANKQNSLNNRLLKLAAKIKGPSAARIYVIQFRSTANTALLQSVASGKDAPYFFNAADPDELRNAFRQIAADLSTLRLTQ